MARSAFLAGLRGKHLQQQVERSRAEGTQVADAIAAAGLERSGTFDYAGNGDAAMASRVAVAVASRARGAALRQRPARAEALPRGLRQQPRIGLGRGPHAERRD